jgi:hypothetical protein
MHTNEAQDDGKQSITGASVSYRKTSLRNSGIIRTHCSSQSPLRCKTITITPRYANDQSKVFKTIARRSFNPDPFRATEVC